MTLSAEPGTPHSGADTDRGAEDRFVGAEFPIPLGPEARRALLDRFGIFGIRLATTLIRTGCDSARSVLASVTLRTGSLALVPALASVPVPAAALAPVSARGADGFSLGISR